jgi:hypothetical protein
VLLPPPRADEGKGNGRPRVATGSLGKTFVTVSKCRAFANDGLERPIDAIEHGSGSLLA